MSVPAPDPTGDPASIRRPARAPDLLARPTTLPSPRQARSRRALEKILAEGESLLEAHAFESAAIADIARGAGSSVGSFYRLVGDKDRLLQAIHARFLTESHAKLTEALDPEHFRGQDAAAVVQGFVAFVADVFVHREGLLRALIVRSSADPSFRLGVHSLNDALEERLGDLLASHRDRIGHAQPQEALRFGVKVVLGALNQNILVHSDEARDTEVLVRELSRVLLAYLAIDSD